jgi:hypothetical protein
MEEREREREVKKEREREGWGGGGRGHVESIYFGSSSEVYFSRHRWAQPVNEMNEGGSGGGEKRKYQCDPTALIDAHVHITKQRLGDLEGGL